MTWSWIVCEAVIAATDSSFHQRTRPAISATRHRVHTTGRLSRPAPATTAAAAGAGMWAVSSRWPRGPRPGCAWWRFQFPRPLASASPRYSSKVREQVLGAQGGIEEPLETGCLAPQAEVAISVTSRRRALQSDAEAVGPPERDVACPQVFEDLRRVLGVLVALPLVVSGVQPRRSLPTTSRRWKAHRHIAQHHPPGAGLVHPGVAGCRPRGEDHVIVKEQHNVSPALLDARLQGLKLSLPAREQGTESGMFRGEGFEFPHRAVDVAIHHHDGLQDVVAGQSRRHPPSQRRPPAPGGHDDGDGGWVRHRSRPRVRRAWRGPRSGASAAARRSPRSALA